MYFFVNPKRVAVKLEKIQRDFLSGKGALDHKLHLVNWSIICMDKWKVGLSIRNLSFLNKALLGKWC